MALTLSTKARNAACDATVDLADEAATPGKLLIRASTTTLVSITLSDPAFGAAATGVATAAGLPLSGTAIAAGVADNFQVTDGDNEVMWSGVVGEGTGDLSLNNTDIAINQQVTITAWTHTQPA